MDKIVCVGKNYADHAKELGDAVPEKPVIFLKPPSILREVGSAVLPLTLPKGVGAVHHECEIVLRLGKGGYRLSQGEAERAISDVTIGLDMTLRDRQAALKKQGHPWTVSKVFPDAAIVGAWIPVGEFRDYLDAEFTLAIDGSVRQRGKGSQMTFSPAQCVAYLSDFFPLVKGDLIYTGTPAGVGPVERGQVGEIRWARLSYSVRWET